MPNLGYHLALREGRFVRYLYQTLLPLTVRRRISIKAELPFEIFSYSGEAALPEQVASIRSFLKHAGRPKQFTVVTDGTYTNRAKELLRKIDACVRIEELPRPAASLPENFRTYLAQHPTGKQLNLIMSLPRSGPTLYLDSDVLFFARASELSVLGTTADAPALYLQDCQLSGDERLLRDTEQHDPPVNTGVLFLFQKVDWSEAIQRFLELEGSPTFFTNQTLTHLALHRAKAQALDSTIYLLRLDDQTSYKDRYAGNTIALRHYVNPVRHKFWTTFWRQ